MATSGTTSSTGSVTTSAIDVASIVAQLMTVENKPLEAITAKITGIQTKISDLGSVKSKIASLQSTLQAFEDPSTYNNPVAQSGDPSIVAAKASGSAAVGSIGVFVSQIAAASSYALHKSSYNLDGVTSYTDFSSVNSVTGIDSDHPFELTISGQTYSTTTTSIVGTGASGAVTLTDLASWVNALGVNVTANTVQTGASEGWVLQIQGTETGVANEITDIGINGGSGNPVTGSLFTPGSTSAPATQTFTFNALNSGESVTVGGLTFTATTNLIAADVAAAFSSLSAGATTKSGITNGSYSGALLTGWDSAAVSSTSSVVFTATQNGAGTEIAYSKASNIETLAVAKDAKAVIGGLSVTRSSNQFSDVVDGITFNITGESTSENPTVVTVSQGADNSSSMITTLMQAYNDLATTYNNLTANSSNSDTPGTFATDPTMLSFVSNIKTMFAYGATDAGSASITGYTSTSQLMSVDDDLGYIKVGSIKYSFSDLGTSTPTVNQFVSWINSLKAGVNANFDGTKINIQNDHINTGFTVDFSGLNATLTRSTTSLASLGLDIQLDGTMQFNTASYQKSAASGLLAKLSKGLKIGYLGETSNLGNFIKAQIDSSKGALVSEINQQQNSIARLQEKKVDLQDHINQIQNNYISQYSALNALLFQLSSTSTSLASALTAITNINAGK